MSLDAEGTYSQAIASRSELEGYFRGGEKPPEKWLLGLEHEKFIYTVEGTPIAYEGERGLLSVFQGMEAYGWEPILEFSTGHTIGMRRGGATLSTEPGGQLEFSGAPRGSVQALHKDNVQHLEELAVVLKARRLQALMLGYRPWDAVEQVPYMPRSRYEAMRWSLAERGSTGALMMLMTATGQVSLDYADEADCIRKVVVLARMAPLLVAMFANSPLREGRPSGYASFRSHVWNDVDKARCGYLASWFDDSFSYARYVDWALDIPLLFLRRGGRYLRPKLSFRQFWKEGFEGEGARLSDWVDHLSTLFPEIRLKQLIEVRSADSVSPPLTAAFAALLRGTVYTPGALEEVALLLPARSLQAHVALHERAQREGLGFEPLAKDAQALVAIASKNLQAWAPEDAKLLEPLVALVQERRMPTEVLSAQNMSTLLK
ncbi:MAG: glutamate-cysteine ligase family protein [Proteobacteria bacterium]|nr:glutamate-cysteine ligase family protein [Cystobacterineae bacterium]MCL2314243.1 glutamate-cysteine ligase family protein [Pseudomonadota bacterium]